MDAVLDEAVGALHGGENRIWVPLKDIPEDVQNAFMAAEDLRFYQQRGVDLYRLFGALWHDLRTFSYAQGASTITQQLIKLTHLTQTKTLSRKAQEIVLALKLEKQMDKSQILEAYLNAVYFGHGAYGVEAAARTYFDKAASELSLAEGALLAGVIKSPTNYAPHLNPEKSVARRNGILETMFENGFITQNQKDAAQGERLRLSMDDGAAQYAWYMDAVLNEAVAALGVDADEVISGGYRIHTGLDPHLQAEAEALFDDYFRGVLE
jgi:membrane peptidoglycan carboxypeptidase